MSLTTIHNKLREFGAGEDTVERVAMPEKGGLGVVAAKAIYKGDYVCEYSGDMITDDEATVREQQYIEEEEAESSASMCYMYMYMSFFTFKGKKYCIDATKTGRIGRLINHSRLQPNLQPKLFVVDGMPRLAFIAISDIDAGTELQFDYGERDPEALKAHPWLLM